MGKHFCTCSVLECPVHPSNHGAGCDPCIQKNLELGEIPTCFWMNVSNIKGTTEYSAESFAKFIMEKKNERDAH